MHVQPAAPLASSKTILPLGDIQGLVLRGYSYYYARHFVFRVHAARDAVAGVRTFIGRLMPGPDKKLCITTAQPWKVAPPACVNVAFTSSGLRQVLGKKRYAQAGTNTTGDLFGPFDQGAARRADKVGDTGASAPANWWRNGNWRLPDPPTSDGLDLVVSLYTRDPADREAFTATLLALVPACKDGKPALEQAFVQDSDPVLDAAGKPTHAIHFGYEDGISQPRIEGTPWDDPGDPRDDSPMVPSWHFVLNPDNPLYNVDPLLQNGCFGAFRLLNQDTAAFDAFLAASGNPALTAAKMCGRWMNGMPLEVAPNSPEPLLSGLDLINFGYEAPTPHQKGPCKPDDLGAQCPYAAHTRRSNPRDDTSVQGNDSTLFPEAQLHRVRRFATPYGPVYTPGSPAADRGLVGWFMGANLTEQFEFIMARWINAPGFRTTDASPNDSGVDALFGPDPDDVVSADFDFDYLPSTGSTYTVVPGLQRFIRTDGGLYGVFPSLTALAAIASGKVG